MEPELYPFICELYFLSKKSSKIESCKSDFRDQYLFAVVALSHDSNFYGDFFCTKTRHMKRNGICIILANYLFSTLVVYLSYLYIVCISSVDCQTSKCKYVKSATQTENLACILSIKFSIKK